jgi:hypothetical protein
MSNSVPKMGFTAFQIGQEQRVCASVAQKTSARRPHAAPIIAHVSTRTPIPSSQTLPPRSTSRAPMKLLLLLSALLSLAHTAHAANYTAPTPLWWLNSFMHNVMFGDFETLASLIAAGNYFAGMCV